MIFFYLKNYLVLLTQNTNFMHVFTFLRKRLSYMLVAFMLFTFAGLQAQTYQYEGSWGSPGLSLVSESTTGVEANFTINEFELTQLDVDGEMMQMIFAPGNFLPNNEGAPNVPGYSRFVAVPQGAQARLRVLNYRIQSIQNVELAPAPPIPLDTDDSPLKYAKNERIYTQNAFYPANPFQLSEPTQIRGVDVVILGVTPFQYNPVTKELLVYHDVSLDVTFEGGNGHFGEDRLRSRWFDPILQDVLMNRESLPEIDYSQRIRNANGRDDAGFEYLIVIPNNDEWLPYAEQIKEWRTKQGILTEILKLQDIGGTTPTILENYFNNAYNTWDIPPVAVLLMADYGSSATNSITSPMYNNYCVSDNIFADVNNNHMPDIIFARMTAQNTTHLQTMVSKMLDYEDNPPTDFNFYNKPITALGWQTERWFQICSETVGGFWREVSGKQPVRINQIYSGTPGNSWSSNQNTSIVVNYFGPNGTGYIPQSPSELGGWNNGSPQMVVNAINDGAFALQHRDHGGEDGWGEPGFVNSHINSLTNNQGNELVFVFSINCLTGKYNWSSECFTEKFHRHTHAGQNAGALGLIAASEVSYSFVNDAYVWGMFDNFYPNFLPDYGAPVEERGFLPAFGNAAGKYFLLQSNWPYNTNNKEVTYHLFHHHGGAFMQVYSEVPQTQAVTHNPILYSGEGIFTVTAGAGAFIALTVNGEIIGTATSTGGATNITIEPQLPPNQMIVTVTRQNYLRYESNVEIIPPSGPYVVGHEYVIHDASGNNNGLLDYGESVTLDMTMKNVGVAAANNVNVTMTTTDAYITIIDGAATFGNIGPGATKTVSNAFAFEAANDIPDGHSVSLKLSATNGTDVWESYVSIQAHAPKLKYAGYTINDPNGNNNGMLDPGETVTMVLTIENSGSSDAFSVKAQLQSTDSYVSVLTTTPQQIGDLTSGSTGTASFMVHAAANTPFGHTAVLNINMTANMGISQQDNLSIVFTDYCEASTVYQDEFISKVVCGDINNSSGWQNAVANYTDITTTLEPGVPVPITVTNGNAWSSDKVTVWIDWNLDKELGSNSNETFVLTSNGGGATFTGNIVAPAGQQSGQYRMRVRMTYSSSPQPCGSSNYGEVEDYTIVIGSQMFLEPPQNVSCSVTGTNVSLSWEAPLPMASSVSGYNIYMDSQVVATMQTGMSYIYNNCPAGSHWFSVAAVYPEGESGVAQPVHVEIGSIQGKIQGFIRDAATNLVIADAWVTALNGDYGAVSYSTPFGSHYTLHLMGGTYNIICNAQGYQSATQNGITIENGGTTTVNFYLMSADSFGEGTTTGLSNSSIADLSIYPNPAREEVNISASEVLLQVKILNNMGQVVYDKMINENNIRINTDNFTNGVYFVEIYTQNGRGIEKLIIK